MRLSTRAPAVDLRQLHQPCLYVDSADPRDLINELGIPALLLIVPLCGLVFWLHPATTWGEFNDDIGDALISIGIGGVLLMCAAVTLAHEVAHLIIFPCSGFYAHAVVGFDLKSKTPFISQLKPIERNRYIVAALSPFILITVCGFIWARCSGQALAWWVALMNGVGAVGDLYIVYRIIKKVPPGRYVLGFYYGALSDCP